jgi:hypothetical protein
LNSRVPTIFCVVILCGAAIAPRPSLGSRQNSGAKPSPASGNSETPAAPPTADSPSSALRNALSAACTHNQGEFSNFLTARNKESFTRLSNAARVALMKRFVLLDEAGKASSSTNPSGRPIVRCETPSVATEMQIGGTDLRDNVAFVPLDLRDSTDGSGATAHVVTMGMIRENGEWKLLSLGLLLLDLPSLEVEWDSAEIESNESAALSSLKKIAEAIETYRTTYSHIPETLNTLAPALHGAATREAANLLDVDLAAGKKNGYVFRYVIQGANTLGAPAKFEISAAPSIYGRTGKISFFRDASGIIHAGDHQGGVGNEADPKAN